MVYAMIVMYILSSVKGYLTCVYSIYTVSIYNSLIGTYYHTSEMDDN